MSHFSEIRLQIKDRDCLVEALESMGFEPQIHTSPIHLYDWLGDKREQTAHIVVPRDQISRDSNDLGFYWNGTEYECLISDYDQEQGASHYKQGLGPNFQRMLQDQYIQRYIPKLVEKLGVTVVELNHSENTTSYRIIMQHQVQVQIQQYA